MTTYYNYLGQAMPVGAAATSSVSASGDNQTLTAPTGPSAVYAYDSNGSYNYDTFIGSNGDNTFYVNNSTDVVQVASGLTGLKSIVSWAGGYTLPDNVQNLTFYGQWNWGAGNSLNNLIVMGGNDHATLDGGGGDDVLVGALYAQNDFQFEVGGGANHDVFYNFHPGLDTVRIAGAGFTSFSQILANMSETTGPDGQTDVVLTIDANNSITFRDTTIAQMQPSSFLLPLDTSQLGALTFSDDFTSLNLFDASTGQGQWQTNFGGDLTKIDAYAITSNDEKQLYTAPNFKGQDGWDLSAYNPFSINSGGGLTITAGQFSYADSQHTWGQAYYSGMLNTRGVFMQKYGYFDMKAQLPTTLGSWPAFWLSQDPYKPGVEGDVLEHLAMYPDIAMARTDDAGTVLGHTTYIPTLSGFHDYGMLWTPTTTTFYIDSLAVMQVATPASWDRPMYLLLDMALGGWGGPIDAAGLPTQMQVQYVHVYGLADSPVDVSEGYASYTAPTGVDSVTLIGSGQTVTANDAGDTLTGNASSETFVLGSGGDAVTGGGGADDFVVNAVPAAASTIADFASNDQLDLSGLLSSLGYTGANALGDGVIRFTDDGHGDAQVWAMAGGAWTLVTTLDGVSASTLAMNGAVVTGGPAESSGSGGTGGTGGAGGTGGTTGQTYTSDNNGDHWTGTAGDDVFNLGRGGDIVTGNGGNDTYAFAQVPWAGGHITDFNAGDVLDLSGLMATTADTGSNGFADGYLKITESSGGAQVWAQYATAGSNSGWWLVETLDGVAASALQTSGDVVTVGSGGTGGTGGAGGTGGTGGTGGSTTGQTYTSDNNGDHWTGTAGDDVFNLGRGGDIVTGNGGNDTYSFAQLPWAGGHITDFNAGDVLDLSGLMSTTADTGSDGFADGYLKITSGSGGEAQIWAQYATSGSNSGWWLVETLDGVSAGSLQTSGNLVGVGAAPTSSGGGSGGSGGSSSTSVTTADANYVAPADVTSITLSGAQQHIDASATSGVTITSNNTGNVLIGGTGADSFHLGRGGDTVTGGAGADVFAYAETPWAAGIITDFNGAQGDEIDVSALLAHSGYTGSDPFADGYLKYTTDGAGNAQLWSDLNQPGNTGWWLVATLDGVSTSSLHYSGGLIT